LADYPFIPKTAPFDPPKNIELTIELKYILSDPASKEMSSHYLPYGMSNWEPFDFNRIIYNNYPALSNFLITSSRMENPLQSEEELLNIMKELKDGLRNENTYRNQFLNIFTPNNDILKAQQTDIMVLINSDPCRV
jgi:hypothetical protein